MSEIQFGRELLKKSIHIATIISKDKAYEKRLWNIACSYVIKARELIPRSAWSTLTDLEQKILHNGVPHPTQFTFFDDSEDAQTGSTEFLPPAPSSWDDIQGLKTRIRALEQEKDKLEEYKILSQRLRCEYEKLDSSHEAYKEKSQQEQQSLQQQLKKIRSELEAASEHKSDATYFEKELDKMKEKIASIYANNHSEMHRLRVELDTANYEREGVSRRLEETQRHLLELMSVNQNYKEQIRKYQQICEFVIPSIGDDIQEQLRELIQAL
jgi:DNA repair exonuclease SbcCD ATPase subunit